MIKNKRQNSIILFCDEKRYKHGMYEEALSNSLTDYFIHK